MARMYLSTSFVLLIVVQIWLNEAVEEQYIDRGKDATEDDGPENSYTLESLREDLQTALELEHATIPPYFTAWATIKNSKNTYIHDATWAILLQEMMHMALVGNILNAVGGAPSLYSEKFIPSYPSRLPGNVQPDLTVPIEKISLGLIRDIFMKIEQPETDQNLISSFQRIFDYARHLRTMKEEGHCHKTDQGILCKPPLEQDSSHEEKKLEMKSRYFPFDDSPINENTIGAFYHRILKALYNLTDGGKNNSIFTGDASRQVDVPRFHVHDHDITVTDYSTAVGAIEKIVEQGEGFSPCNPFSLGTEGDRQLSHYYQFYSIVEKRELEALETGTPPDGIPCIKLCNRTYCFSGTEIPFDRDGVWPIIPNARMTDYTNGSIAFQQARTFNEKYTKLLETLDEMFNGHPDKLGEAVAQMSSVHSQLTTVVETPVDDSADPDIVLNAGPTFDFTPQ